MSNWKKYDELMADMVRHHEVHAAMAKRTRYGNLTEDDVKALSESVKAYGDVSKELLKQAKANVNG